MSEPETQNGVELHGGGDELFPRMLECMGQARSRIHLEVYTMALDEVGERFVAALESASDRGVKVRVVLDGFGSIEDGEEIAYRLRHHGADVTLFHPLSAWIRGKMFRNHRKLLLVDDEIAFIGGINIAQEYASTELKAGWADIAVEVRGPACERLGRTLRGERLSPQPAGEVRIFLSGIGGGRRLQRRYLKALKKAQRRVYMAQAYFLPSRALIRALIQAAKRGVDVNLLLAGRSDVPFARIASQRLYRRLLSAGVRIYEWHESVLHAKAAAVDDARLLVGSFNLDPLSLVNLEALVEVHDPPTVTKGLRWMESRAAYSREVTLESVKRSRLQAWLWEALGLWAARITEFWAQLTHPNRRRRIRRRRG